VRDGDRNLKPPFYRPQLYLPLGKRSIEWCLVIIPTLDDELNPPSCGDGVGKTFWLP
jgi:hypothetical protein